VDQRRERTGQMRGKVGINSLAMDPQRPYLLLTGGADPLGARCARRATPGGLILTDFLGS